MSALLFGIPLRYIALVSLVIQTTSAVILTRYAKLTRPEGSVMYQTTTLVVLSEFGKFLLSALFILLLDCHLPVQQHGGEDGEQPAHNAHSSFFSSLLAPERFAKFKKVVYDECLASPVDTLKLAVPALFYTLQNNLIYVALANLEATTFQVGYQMKVITTAILSVLMLNRILSQKSWIALFLLTAGIVMTQLSSSRGPSDSGDRKDQNFSIGLTSVIICGFCSAFAGVYFEKILKGTNPTVWMRNLQLAFFATLIGIAGSIYADGMRLYTDGHFFQGYDRLTWILILIQAAGGLIVAVVVKYADNILKGFAAGISIILCGICSVQLFDASLSSMFMVGSSVVIFATILYSTPDKVPAPTPTQPNHSRKSSEDVDRDSDKEVV